MLVGMLKIWADCIEKSGIKYNVMTYAHEHDCNYVKGSPKKSDYLVG